MENPSQDKNLLKTLLNEEEKRRREGRSDVDVTSFDLDEAVRRQTRTDPISTYLNTGEGLGEALDAIGEMLDENPRVGQRTVGAIANGKPLPKPGPRKLLGVTPDVVIVDEVQVEEDPFAGRMTTRSFQGSMELRALQGKLHAEERRKLERGKGNRGARRIDPKARRQK